MPSALHPTKGKLSQGLELKRKHLLHDLLIIDRDAPRLSSKKRKCDNSSENELVQERYGSKVERIQRFASDDLDGRTTDSDAPFSTNRTNLCDPTTKVSTYAAVGYRKDAESSSSVRTRDYNKQNPPRSTQLSSWNDHQFALPKQCVAYIDIAHELEPHDGDITGPGVSFQHSQKSLRTVAHELDVKDGAQQDPVMQTEEGKSLRWKIKGRRTRGPQRKREIQASFTDRTSGALAFKAASDVDTTMSASSNEAIATFERQSLEATRTRNDGPGTITKGPDEGYQSGEYFRGVGKVQDFETAEPCNRTSLHSETEPSNHIRAYGITVEPLLQEPGKVICPHCEQQHNIEILKEHVARCEARHTGKLRKRDLSKPKSRCWKCNRSFMNANGPLSELDVHVAQCPKKNCTRCHKKNISAEDYAAHFAACDTKKHSGCGNPVCGDKIDAHVKSCPWGYCSKCKKSRIPISDLQRHLKLCRMRSHPACSGQFHESIFEDHVKKCPWRLCARCGKNRIPVEDYRSHVDSCPHFTCVACNKTGALGDHDCGKTKCSSCARGILTELYPSHKALCTDQLHKQRSALAIQTKPLGRCCYLKTLNSTFCMSPRWKAMDVCEKHAKTRSSDAKNNTVVEKAQLRKLLTDPATEILTEAMLSTIDMRTGKFITRLLDAWDTIPERILLGDTEGNIHSQPKKPEHTFQLTIKNAKGENVVSRRVINHPHLTKSELREQSGASSSFIVDACFRRFYGNPESTPAIGHPDDNSSTWLEVANDIEKYIDKYELQGPDFFFAFIDWSSAGVDLAGLRAGLKYVGKDYLVPVCPECSRGSHIRTADNFLPLQWWREFRRFAGLEADLSLALSNLFSILYPESNWLFDHAHDSDADVDMLHMVLDFTLRIWRALRDSGKIDPAAIGETKDTVQEISNDIETERDQDDLEAYVDSIEEG